MDQQTMSIVNFQFVPLSVSAVEAKILETMELTDSSERFKALSIMEFMIEPQSSWFSEEEPRLAGDPIKIIDWMEELFSKCKLPKNSTLVFYSTYVRSIPNKQYSSYIVCHVEATIYGRKPAGDENRYKVTVRTDNRFTTITPFVVSVKDVNNRIALNTHALSLMTDGSKKWIRTFHRQATPLAKDSYYCPTTMRLARHRTHSLIGHFTGYESVDAYYRRWFSDISPIQENMDGPTKLDQAVMQRDIIEFFSTEHTEEEVAAFVKSIKAREIEAGVSKYFPIEKKVELISDILSARKKS